MHDNRGTVPVIVAVAILLLPVVYALAIGPVHWLYMAGYVDENCGRAFDPVFWLCRQSDTLGHTLRAYLDFWTPPEWGPI